MLLAAEYRDAEVALEGLGNSDLFSQPFDTATMDKFGPHVRALFRSLPVQHTVPSGYGPSAMHIEFVQFRLDPYPVFAVVAIPFAHYIVDVVAIPRHMQLFPLSRDTFTLVWRRLVWQLHLGEPSSGARFRPAEFTVPDSPAESAFAHFLREQTAALGDTKVTIVPRS